MINVAPILTKHGLAPIIYDFPLTSSPSVARMFPTLPLPPIAIKADDHVRIWRLAAEVSRQLPYVSAYLERELKRAQICDP